MVLSTGTLSVLSWNARGCSKAAAAQLLRDLEQDAGCFDVICLQETAEWGSHVPIGDFICFSSAKEVGTKSVSLAIRSTYAARILGDSFFCKARTIKIDIEVPTLGLVSLVSAHLEASPCRKNFLQN